MKTYAFLIMGLFGIYASCNLYSQTTNQKKDPTTVEYIERYKHIAKAHEEIHKIPACITLAQGILESGSGTSRLAKEANNHFGIKCHSNWQGNTFHKDDDKKNECFRAYDTPEESFEDHALFLKKKRYADLFDLDIKDYEGWAKGLKQAGYATNPKYPQLLIDLIEKYSLQDLDNMENEKNEPAIAQNEAINQANSFAVSTSSNQVSEKQNKVLEEQNEVSVYQYERKRHSLSSYWSKKTALRKANKDSKSLIQPSNKRRTLFGKRK